MEARFELRAPLLALALVAVACGGGSRPADTAGKGEVPPAEPNRPGVWFRGDFESGDLAGWAPIGDRTESVVVVDQPVRRGRHAARLFLETGDLAAGKERVELKVADGGVERVRALEGSETWYGWSLLVPEDFEDPPPDTFQIVAQWHHRPHGRRPGRAGKVAGPPPLLLFLTRQAGQPALLLTSHAPRQPPRTVGEVAIEKGKWIDLVFHVRWSSRPDGFVEAWAGERPLTAGRQRVRTLFRQGSSNYLRLGLYRPKGVPTANVIFLDEVRIGASRAAVAP